MFATYFKLLPQYLSGVTEETAKIKIKILYILLHGKWMHFKEPLNI
jgi:hypothetical protein